MLELESIFQIIFMLDLVHIWNCFELRKEIEFRNRKGFWKKDENLSLIWPEGPPFFSPFGPAFHPFPSFPISRPRAVARLAQPHSPCFGLSRASARPAASPTQPTAPQPARPGPAGGPLSSALLPRAPTPALASTGPLRARVRVAHPALAAPLL